MKKTIPWILIGILGLILLLLSDRSRLKNDLRKIEQEYTEFKGIHQQVVANLEEKILKKDDKIAELNGALDSSSTIVASLEEKIVGKDKDLEKIRKSWASFSIECQVKLEEIDTAWAAKFSLAQVEIEEFKKQVKIADERDLYRQGQMLDLRAIISEKDKIIASCEAAQKDIVRACLKDKQRINLTGNLKTLSGLALGFVLGKL